MANARVGDTVNVPGDMHGIVKFIGSVAGKKGTFAGVQLASEYATRGKNSGEVDGKHYFRTTIPGSGIFLPVEKAVKRSSGPTAAGVGSAVTPKQATPTKLNNFNQGGRMNAVGKAPNFSQSLGPAQIRNGALSPALKPPSARKDSFQRPASPLRKVNTPTIKSLATPKTRPSIGMTKSTVGTSGQYKASPGPRVGNKFSQSLRQPSSTSNSSRESPLGPESSFDELPEDAENTPTPTPYVHRKTDEDVAGHEKEVKRLKQTLEERDRQLKEQAISIAEMEKSLTELQKLVPGLSEERQNGKKRGSVDDDDLPRDVVKLRNVLKEKNERIKMLTAEFDANRADFRSTIDTLEMASTETERVYEKRVDELLEEVRHLQDRSEDVEGVAQQFRQLEELVQELEEGLEDARRGEAEARGEVEFLRGEVERSRSELRRERERLRTEEQLNGYTSSSDGHVGELQSLLETKEDEIRGLKAIINNLNGSEGRVSRTNTNGNGPGHARNDSVLTDDSQFSLQRQIRDLESLLQEKSAHQEELENEVTKLRSNSALARFPMPTTNFGIRTGYGAHNRDDSVDLADRHKSSGTTGSQRTVIPDPTPSTTYGQKDKLHSEWHDAATSPVKKQEIDRDREVEEKRSEAEVTDASSSTAALWCEMCEKSGHDILSCANMFGNGNGNGKMINSNHTNGNGTRNEEDEINQDRPAPLASKKNSTSNPNISTGTSSMWQQQQQQYKNGNENGNGNVNANGNTTITTTTTTTNSHEKEEEINELEIRNITKPIEGTGDQAGMWAGKHSQIIDPDKWCALCERDGHESVDCPIEDSF